MTPERKEEIRHKWERLLLMLKPGGLPYEKAVEAYRRAVETEPELPDSGEVEDPETPAG